MTDKQIIKKFSDGHCLVLENNQISLREDELTAYRIVLGKSTNELFEFVKDTYLQLKAKEQECEELKDKVERLTILGMDLNQSNEVLRKSFFIANKNKDNWREKAEKLSKTLTEIKEIAKPFCEECKEFDDLHKERDCMYCNYGKILQKISEVE